MKQGGGKQKGGQFERDVCKMLSLWVSDRTNDDLFWRSAMSGGRATVRAQKGKSTASGHGDITAVTPGGNSLTNHFVIECKTYKTLGLGAYVYNQGPLGAIWKKLQNEADAVKKLPMLVMKENRKPILVGLQRPVTSYYPLVSYWDNLEIYYLEVLLSINFPSFINEMTEVNNEKKVL